MDTAYSIVQRLLGETGEADQDYDHVMMDRIVRAVAKAGFPGGTHREFDKYQGVYMRIPGVDKFWVTDIVNLWDGKTGVQLHPEDGREDELYVMVSGNGRVDASELIGYIKQKYGPKFAQMRAQKDAESFIDQSFG